MPPNDSFIVDTGACVIMTTPTERITLPYRTTGTARAYTYASTDGTRPTIESWNGEAWVMGAMLLPNDFALACELADWLLATRRA